MPRGSSGNADRDWGRNVWKEPVGHGGPRKGKGCGKSLAVFGIASLTAFGATVKNVADVTIALI